MKAKEELETAPKMINVGRRNLFMLSVMIKSYHTGEKSERVIKVPSVPYNLQKQLTP